jgi:prepilin-type N-terminal cleavage/methylation domain-containing protein
MANRQAGFTLTELLVAMGIAGLVLAAVGVTLQFGMATVQAGVDQTESQQNGRQALQRLIEEIRGAGYDPTATPPPYTFPALTLETATRLVLQSDLNGNGVLDAQGACDASAPAEIVGYRLVGTQLRRSTDPPAWTCEAVLVTGLAGLTFGYLDANRAVLGLPVPADATRTVVVTLTARSETGGGERSVVFMDWARLRNR